MGGVSTSLGRFSGFVMDSRSLGSWFISRIYGIPSWLVGLCRG